MWVADERRGFVLPEMRTAYGRLCAAGQKKENITVYFGSGSCVSPCLRGYGHSGHGGPYEEEFTCFRENSGSGNKIGFRRGEYRFERSVA